MHLISHPAHSPGAITSVDAYVTRATNGLMLSYTVTGDIDELVLPAKSEPGRAEDLWQTTCFELFLRGDGPAYREYNFSSSGEWAAYAFDSHREGRREIPATITIATDGDAETLNLSASLITDLDDVVCLAPTAVIEDRSGHKSYWAIAHHAGPPDFHHDACFALRLADIGAA